MAPVQQFPDRKFNVADGQQEPSPGQAQRPRSPSFVISVRSRLANRRFNPLDHSRQLEVRYHNRMNLGVYVPVFLLVISGKSAAS